jgi:hypothetical protein
MMSAISPTPSTTTGSCSSKCACSKGPPGGSVVAAPEPYSLKVATAQDEVGIREQSGEMSGDVNKR